MTNEADRRDLRLTRPQRENLLLLHRQGAHSAETGKHIFDPGCRDLSPGSIGALIRHGLADKRTKRLVAGGSQVTIYWLTGFGRAITQVHEAGEAAKAIRTAAAGSLARVGRLA